MRIVHIDPAPVHQVRYLNAAKRGGVQPRRLPISLGRVKGLPKALDGLVLTSDLQGVGAGRGGESVLLGVELAQVLLGLADKGVIPEPSSLGVILAGDLYSAPGAEIRGATGDVRGVWRAFAERFRWVAGVAGNHDEFGRKKQRRRLRDEPNVHLLDGRVVTVDGLRLGGVGYVIGDTKKTGRRDELDLLAALDSVLERKPKLVVLHQGPGGGPRQRGDERIRRAVDAADKAPFVVCGHVHWDNPLAQLRGGQVVNVDGRVLVLTRA